jgi:hypothetical protein
VPRFEIVGHLTCELAAESAEDAAAVFQHQVLAKAGVADDVLQLAVWRQESVGTASPLPTTLRQQLIDFFAALEQSAVEAEAAFRERVGAILAVPGPAADPAVTRGPSGATDYANSR